MTPPPPSSTSAAAAAAAASAAASSTSFTSSVSSITSSSSSLTSLAPVASRQCDALAQRAYAAIATAERVWREAAESLHSKLVKYAAYHPSHHLTPHHAAARTPCYFFRSPFQAGGYAA